MKKQAHQRNEALQSASFLRRVLFITAFFAPSLYACAQSGQQPNQMNRTSPQSTDVKTETFQEIGFFGEVKKEQWNSFVQAVQNNINHSRKEQGNISFSLYQPEDGQREPIWFERYHNKPPLKQVSCVLH